MTSLYKDAERLVTIIKPFVSRAVPTIESEEDLSKLEYLLELRSGSIKDKLKVERELLSLEERYYDRIIGTLHEIRDTRETDSEKKAIEDRIRSTMQAKDGDIRIATYNVDQLEKELGTTRNAFEVMLNLLKDDPGSFKVVYNNDRPKDDRETPHPLDEIESKHEVVRLYHANVHKIR